MMVINHVYIPSFQMAELKVCFCLSDSPLPMIVNGFQMWRGPVCYIY